MSYSRHAALVLLSVVAASLGAGCTQPISPLSPRPSGPLSVHQLASRLNLRVEDASYCMATLRGPGNTVVIYADPRGQAFVNGRSVGRAGGIYCVNGTLHVPPEVEPAIRNAMAAPPPSVSYIPPPLPPSLPQKPEKPPLTPSVGRVAGRVVIDAGHGGKDPGTKGLGTNEKTVNLALALAVAERLQRRGVKVTLTRDDDNFLELEERSAIANRIRADLFVSIHCNWTQDTSKSGFMTFVAQGASAKSDRAARSIDERLCGMGAERYGRAATAAKYRVLMCCDGPSVLVETGFMSNRRECAKLIDPSYQNRLADALAEGICDYLCGR